MSYFDDASLVMIPSGYKDQKVYSVKPLDGAGDLTFSRASSATRVASNGLIEKVRTNLALQSQTFDNASWTKTIDGQVTITANAAVAPDGTTTAEKMIPSAIAGFHCVQQGVSISASEVSVSVFAKAAEYSFLQIFDGLTSEFANFNLTTGVVGSTDTYVASIESVGNGWYRCKATKTAPSGTFNFRYGVVTSGTAVRGESFTGNGTDGLLIWGAQLEYGVATDYIATTTAAVSVGPVSGLPRLDYLGSTCPRLLLEPQRTNLLLYSEQFDNGYWTKTASTTITANANVSPSGYQDADTYTTTASGTGSQIYRVISVGGTTQTLSIFIKYLSGSGTNLRFSIGSVESLGVNLTFSNSGATLTGVKGSSVNTLNIENYGNNWFRVSISVAYASATAEFNLFRPTGTGTDAYAIWGAQLETSTAYATSYIPTLGTSVTRVADAASKTSATALIGQTEGTLFVDVSGESLQNDSRYMSISDFNDPNKRITIYQASGNINVYCSAGSTFNLNYNPPAGRLKIAFGYKSGQYVLYVNGVNAASSTEAVVQGCPDLGLGVNEYLGTANPPAVGYNQVLLFKTRLTNAQLAELTTL